MQTIDEIPASSEAAPQHLSLQPLDWRPFWSVSAYSGLFAPDFAPGNLAQRERSFL